MTISHNDRTDYRLTCNVLGHIWRPSGLQATAPDRLCDRCGAFSYSHTKVWGVWSHADYYGPHLQSLHRTEESAQAEADRLNDKEWPKRPADHDWPFVVEKHKVQP